MDKISPLFWYQPPREFKNLGCLSWERTMTGNDGRLSPRPPAPIQATDLLASGRCQRWERVRDRELIALPSNALPWQFVFRSRRSTAVPAEKAGWRSPNHKYTYLSNPHCAPILPRTTSMFFTEVDGGWSGWVIPDVRADSHHGFSWELGGVGLTDSV